MLFSIPKETNEIIGILEEHGYEAYLVGGCVRDSLMGIQPKDYDICTSARPEEISALFPETILTGLKHGTVTVIQNHLPFEITTFRVESSYADHRHPDRVWFSTSLEEDLQRRDFTINAMAYHPERGVIDPFGGRNDIKEQLIRTVGEPEERFGEDALRMLRAIRFQSRFGFHIEPKTITAIGTMSKTTAHVSRERVLIELNGILTGTYPTAFLNLFTTGLTSYIFPFSIPFKPDMKQFFLLPCQLPVRWAAILKLMNVVNLPDIRNICCSLKMSHALKTDISLISDILNSPLPDTAFRIRRKISATGFDVFTNSLRILEVFGIATDTLDRIYPVLEKVVSEKQCIRLSDLALSGSDLIAAGLSPGKKLGEILNLLFLCVLQNPALNRKDILLKFSEEMAHKPFKNEM